MLVVPTWQFLHKRQIPSMRETSLQELSAYCLRAWLSPSPANDKLDSKLPSTQLLRTHFQSCTRAASSSRVADDTGAL